MRKLSFCEKGIKLTMSCVSKVTYSVLVNSIPRESFIPTMGLRQGDLLSPYLFLLCAEKLSSLINLVEMRGDIR